VKIYKISFNSTVSTVVAMTDRPILVTLMKAASWTLALVFFVACEGTGLPETPLQRQVTDGVVGGVYVPGGQHPWTVGFGTDACHGVLIHPRWILTAAHCDTPGPVTLPLNGNPAVQQTRSVREQFTHPDYNESTHEYDMKLVQLETPFTINAYVQTVGLPNYALPVSAAGTVVTAIDHDGDDPPEGYLAIYRGDIAQYTYEQFEVFSESSAQLEPGDSGSGFVAMDRSPGRARATVFGVASGITQNAVSMVNVFQLKQWIIDTLASRGTTTTDLLGNVTLRPDQAYGAGALSLSCSDLNGNPISATAPMEVEGVELALNCYDSTIEGICAPDAPALRIGEFTLSTNGNVLSLSHSDHLGVYQYVDSGVVAQASFRCRVDLQPSLLAAIL
jgi:hypothetical protein